MINMEKLTINQWAEEDRPREKMMLKGAEALSDAELLAILIGSGNTEESAVSLMQRVLSTCGNDLNQLGKWEVQDFSSFKGFGPAKSITIMAALELGKRRKYRNVRSVPPSALPKTSTKSFTRFFATWHTKNSGFYSLTRLPASSTNPASAAAASTRLLPTYAASCAKP